MTTPGGPGSLNPNARFGITGDSAHGTTVADLQQRLQAEMEARLKADIKGSQGWKGASDAAFGGLMLRGTPGQPVSIPLAIVASLAARLLGVDPQSWLISTDPHENVERILAELKKVPFLDDLIELITGVEDGDESDLGTWALGIRNALAGIDLSNPGAVLAAIQNAVQDIPGIGDFFEVVTGNPDSDPNDAGSFIRNALDAIRNGAQGGSAPAPGNSFITDLFNSVKGVLTTANSAQSSASSAQTTAGNAQAAASNASGLASAANSTLAQLTNGFTGAVNGALNALQSLANTAKSTADSAQTTAGNASTQAQGIIDRVSGVLGGPTSGNVVDTITTNVGAIFNLGNNAQNQAIINAAQMAAIMAANTGAANSGVSGSDSFDRTGNDLGSTGWDFTLSGAGGVRTNGNDAYWSDSGNGAATEVDRFKTVTCLTDSQIYSMVLSSPILESPILGSGECYNGLIGRIDAPKQNYVYVRVGYNSIGLWKVTGGGAPVQIGASQPYSPQPGDTIGLICGVTAAAPRKFRILVNGAAMGPDLDDTSGTLSVYGVSNRQGGKRWDSVPRLSGQATPGRIAAFTIADYTAPTYVGSVAKLVRTNTASVNFNSAETVLANNFWTSNQRSTSDYVVDVVTGKFTVLNAGNYLVHLRYQVSSWGGNSYGHAGPVLFKNGAAYERGASGFVAWDQNNVLQFWPSALDGVFIVPMVAGDYLQAGYWSGVAANSPTVVGVAGEKNTYFSISLLNRSLA
ncbi:hypothetical protein BKG86_01770 [Mycobacteroides chelonae]|uniref:DUF7257 domain-containing protein n=1 Tax=Mycobacteroides chelonae TaxID=1774 RepID=UPI0008A96BEC|nr:hypothetical protein [Mycobacteroides chelonae]OHU68807.1 hypothetical protein BKG86_01770 [Mycobacteroides chelonae]